VSDLLRRLRRAKTIEPEAALEVRQTVLKGTTTVAHSADALAKRRVALAAIAAAVATADYRQRGAIGPAFRSATRLVQRSSQLTNAMAADLRAIADEALRLGAINEREHDAAVRG
jgi:hypothetical protein